MGDGRQLEGAKRSRISSLLDSLLNRETLGKILKACRLPRRGLESPQSIPAAPDNYELRHMVRKYAKELAIAALAFSLLTALIIAPVVHPSPEVSVSKVAPLTGTRGWNVTHDDCRSSMYVFLINNTNLDRDSGWYARSNHLDQSPVVNSTPPDGFRVIVTADQVLFKRSIHIPFQDYESFHASLAFEVVSGSANVSLAVFLQTWTSDLAESEVNAGQSRTLAVNPSLGDVKVLYPGLWFCRVTFQIQMSTEERAVVGVHSFQVVAHSSRTLAPLFVDLQTTDGASILAKPSFAVLVGSWWYLLLNISRNDDGRQGTVVVRLANESLYLPSGNYSVKAGWFDDHEWYHPMDYELEYELAEFAMRENQTAFLRVRLQTVRLSFEQSPTLVSGFVTVMTHVSYGQLCWYWLGAETALAMAYMPALMVDIEILVSHTSAWETHGAADYWYESDGSSDLLVSIDYQSVTVLGIVLTGMDIGTILLLAALIVALLARFRHVLFPKKMRPLLRDPGLIPALLMMAGAFLPWFSYDYHVGLFSGVILPPFTIITRQTAFGLTAPYMFDQWQLVLPLYLALFWVPALGTLNQIGREAPVLSWIRVICVACPALLALASLLVGASLGWVPDAGIWPVMLSPVVFFVQVVFQRILAATRNSA